MHVRSSGVNNYNEVKIKPPTSLALHHLLLYCTTMVKEKLTCFGKKLSTEEPLSNEKLEDTPDQISLFTNHAALCVCVHRLDDGN